MDTYQLFNTCTQNIATVYGEVREATFSYRIIWVISKRSLIAGTEGIWLATPLAEAITLAIAVAGIRMKKGH